MLQFCKFVFNFVDGQSFRIVIRFIEYDIMIGLIYFSL